MDEPYQCDTCMSPGVCTGREHKRGSHKVYMGGIREGLLRQLMSVTQSLIDRLWDIGWQGWRKPNVQRPGAEKECGVWGIESTID